MVTQTDPFADKRARLPNTLKDPFLTGCKFDQCGMYKTNKPIRPRGDWDAEAMWLGESPGLQEEKYNCTFIGPAGKLTEQILNEIGLSLDKNFLVPNVTLCRPHPPAGSIKQNRTPTISEIRICHSYLEKIVRLHSPKVIVLVGGQAAKSVMENPPAIGKLVGSFFGPEEHDFPVEADLYAVWHPAYILRNMEKKSEWKRQLIRLRDYMKGRGLVKK